MASCVNTMLHRPNFDVVNYPTVILSFDHYAGSFNILKQARNVPARQRPVPTLDSSIHSETLCSPVNDVSLHRFQMKYSPEI